METNELPCRVCQTYVFSRWFRAIYYMTRHKLVFRFFVLFCFYHIRLGFFVILDS